MYKLRFLCSIMLFSLFIPRAFASDISLEEQAGQMVMVGFHGTSAQDAGVVETLINIEKGSIGGVILFERSPITNSTDRNIVSLQQISSLTSALQAKAKTPLFIAIDQEGGLVVRIKPELGMPELLSPQELGQLSLGETKKYAETTAKSLRSLGINTNFAPGVDVNINPDSPAIGALGRSFSRSADSVILHANAFTAGLAQYGILSCYKHFPGHGSATEDSHNGLVDITDTWQKEELAPYEFLLSKKPQTTSLEINTSNNTPMPSIVLPDMVMVGHLVHRDIDPALPSSLSYNFITTMLRQDIGWDGVVITDDLDMKAIADHYSVKETIFLAIEAGVDIILFGNNLADHDNIGNKVHSTILELVAEGRVSPKRITESYTRIMQLKNKIYQ